MNKVASIKAFADSDTARYHLKVIEYYKSFGLSATLSAFPVKRSTVFLWQKVLKENSGRLISLVPKSSRPHTCRRMQTHPLILAEICRLRKEHYRLGKKKPHFLLRRYSGEVGLPTCPKVSTIGKIIKRNHIFFDKPTFGYHDPGRKKPEGIKKVRGIYAPKPELGGYVEMDTIETIVGSVRRYTICAIDVKLKIAYAQTFKSKSSKNAITVLETLASMLLCPIHTIQTDNGSEFLGVFDYYCRKNGIKHHFTYPKHPKINGVVERFNRSIQEEWLNTYQDEMVEPDLINQRIIEYLLFYHNDRIHEGLGDRTPASILGKEIKSPKGV